MRELHYRLRVVALLTAAFLVPLASASGQQTPQRGGVLRIAHVGDPPSLDTHMTGGAVPTHILNNVYEGLFAMDSKFQPRPMLAERLDLSPDRRTYTFTLRRGVRFHHGREMTGDDVRASLERWGRVNPRGRVVFENVAAVTTPSPLTVVVRLKEPYALFLHEIGSYHAPAAVYPKEVIDEVPAGAPVRRFIGTGPYRVAERFPDRHIRLDRFDGYTSRTEPSDGGTGAKHAYLDSIFFVPIPDPAIRVAGVQRNEYQFAQNIPSDEHDRIRAIPGMQPYVATIPFWAAVIFNNQAGLMANNKVRQAFQAAVDSESVMRAAYGASRFWRLTPGLMPKEHPLYTEGGKELYSQNNPQRARQLLQEAGYKGEPVRWMTSTDLPPLATAAQAIKPMLERAGFVVDLQFMDWATLVGRRGRPDLWDAFSVQIPFFPDPVLMTPLQSNWPGWWTNRDGQALIELLKRHTDPKVRVELWARLQRLWYQDAGSLKLGDFFEMHAHRRELKGFFEAPTNTWWNTYLER